MRWPLILSLSLGAVACGSGNGVDPALHSAEVGGRIDSTLEPARSRSNAAARTQNVTVAVPPKENEVLAVSR